MKQERVKTNYGRTQKSMLKFIFGHCCMQHTTMDNESRISEDVSGTVHGQI